MPAAHSTSVPRDKPAARPAAQTASRQLGQSADKTDRHSTARKVRLFLLADTLVLLTRSFTPRLLYERRPQSHDRWPIRRLPCANRECSLSDNGPTIANT